MEVKSMLLHTKSKEMGQKLLIGFIVLFTATIVSVVFCEAAKRAVAKPKSLQRTFASPEEAVAALINALKTDDVEDLSAILGPEGKQLIFSGDEIADKNARQRFSRMYDEKNQLKRESEDKAVLDVGNNDWPFPIPIVKAGEAWHFDTRQGKTEILNRRIGGNELDTIQTCLAYVDAQHEYASKDRNGDGLFEYAQKFSSEPGKKDGLYWETKEGEEQSPLGPLVAQARSEGYKKKKPGDKPVPYHGYYYRILKAQGVSAPGGAYDYVVKGKMIGGFALVAYPAQYGSSGIMTFIVSHGGDVYQKDLGGMTAATAQAMKTFNPDKTWSKVDPKYLQLPGKGD
jgi:hypothetical protein